MALTDHVIVLAHLQPQVIAGPPTRSYEETLRLLEVPEAAIMALPEAHRAVRVGMEGRARVSHSALSIRPMAGLLGADGRPAQEVAEVDWPCGCGKPLHSHHDAVLGAWAQHVARAEGIDADHLEAHVVLEIDGRWRPDGKPRVYCRCGERFESPEFLPVLALAAWEAHVRAS